MRRSIQLFLLLAFAYSSACIASAEATPTALALSDCSPDNIVMIQERPSQLVQLGSLDRMIRRWYGAPPEMKVFEAQDYDKIYCHYTTSAELQGEIIRNGELRAGQAPYVSAMSGGGGCFLRESYEDCRGVFFTDTHIAAKDVGVPHSGFPVFFKLDPDTHAAVKVRHSIYLVPLQPDTMLPIIVVPSDE